MFEKLFENNFGKKIFDAKNFGKIELQKKNIHKENL